MGTKKWNVTTKVICCKFKARNFSITLHTLSHCLIYVCAITVHCGFTVVRRCVEWVIISADNCSRQVWHCYPIQRNNERYGSGTSSCVRDAMINLIVRILCNVMQTWNWLLDRIIQEWYWMGRWKSVFVQNMAPRWTRFSWPVYQLHHWRTQRHKMQQRWVLHLRERRR